MSMYLALWFYLLCKRINDHFWFKLCITAWLIQLIGFRISENLLGFEWKGVYKINLIIWNDYFGDDMKSYWDMGNQKYDHENHKNSMQWRRVQHPAYNQMNVSISSNQGNEQTMKVRNSWNRWLLQMNYLNTNDPEKPFRRQKRLKPCETSCGNNVGCFTAKP